MKKTIVKIYRELSENKQMLYIIFCLILWSCGNSNITNADKKQSNVNRIQEQQKTDLPRFLFDNISHDFGDIIQGELASYTFYFKNIGQSDLVIYSVDATCGCTSAVSTKEPIKPENQGEITVTFDTKTKSGTVTNHLVINANTYPAQTVLTINANVVNQ